jgi:hypothetical protein
VPAGSEARLNGKILAALLMEAFIAKASFFPYNQIELYGVKKEPGDGSIKKAACLSGSFARKHYQ